MDVLRVETTPNPNSRKFVVAQSVATTTRWYATSSAAHGDGLAEAVFRVSGVTNVMLLNNFITVGKSTDVEWDALIPAITLAIKPVIS